MVTRIRVEAEGSTPAEVEQILESVVWAFGEGITHSPYRQDVYGYNDEALIEAQAGELVIERFAKDTDDQAGHGVIYYRGRMVVHYARPSKPLDLKKHVGAVVMAPAPKAG